MAYRGKVMNRAARISAFATSGQVLCSGLAWNLGSKRVLRKLQIRGSSVGEQTFKGVTDTMEIFHCMVRDGQPPIHTVMLEDLKTVAAALEPVVPPSEPSEPSELTSLRGGAASSLVVGPDSLSEEPGAQMPSFKLSGQLTTSPRGPMIVREGKLMEAVAVLASGSNSRSGGAAAVNFKDAATATAAAAAAGAGASEVQGSVVLVIQD